MTIQEFKDHMKERFNIEVTFIMAESWVLYNESLTSNYYESKLSEEIFSLFK